MTLLSKFDPNNYFLVLRDFPQQFLAGVQLAKDFKVEGPVKHVILAGMGGSALPGDFVNDYLSGELEIKIVRDYALPTNIEADTLVIVASYSGNTEETLSVFNEALDRRCKVAAISANGKLLEEAHARGIPHLQLPQGFQPRQMLGYMFTALISLFQNSGMISDRTQALMSLAEEIDDIEYEEKAKMMAEVLHNEVPIIYTTSRYRSLAQFWKICFNENAKIQSFFNVIPEVNHNEMVGYTNLKMQPHFIFLESENNDPRNVKRIEIMKKMFQDRKMLVSEFTMHGSDMLTQLFTTALFGYWVSYFLAIMYETDPTPVEWVEEFKKYMAE